MERISLCRAVSMIPARDRLSLMIVDGEDMIRRLLARVFAWHDVCEIADADRALALLNEGRPIDVIITEVELPGSNGVAFHRALQRSHPLLASRMVFITGGDMTEEISESLKRTGRPVVLKPFGGDRIRATVEAAAVHVDWATLIGLGARQHHLRARTAKALGSS